MIQISDILHVVPNVRREEIRRGLISGKFDDAALGEILKAANKATNDRNANVSDVVIDAISLQIGRKVVAGQLKVA